MTPEPLETPCEPFTLNPTTDGATEPQMPTALAASPGVLPDGGCDAVLVTNTGVGWLTAPAAISTPPQTRAPTTPEMTPTSQVRASGPTNHLPTERLGGRAGTDGLERTSEGCLQSRSSGGSHVLPGWSSSSSPGPCGGPCSGSMLHTRLLTCSAALTSAPRDLRPFDFGGWTGVRLGGVAASLRRRLGRVVPCSPRPRSVRNLGRSP
jgi:hypothetical protein